MVRFYPSAPERGVPSREHPRSATDYCPTSWENSEKSLVLLDPNLDPAGRAQRVHCRRARMSVQSGRADTEIDIEFRRATKRFGAIAAVDAVDLQVRKGEFLSLLGPSGCGKTTSLRLMAGFEQPDEGEILIGGVNAVGIPPYRRDVNTVFQSYALFPHMTVLDNVAYGLKQRGVAKAERRARAREALDLVQLSGREKHRPSMLSGGQQQRVALARALVMNPRVLLLDEPLGALDQKLRKEMQVELKRIQETVGITFVYVTHDQEEALSMSDRVAVMSSGHIEQLDEPRAIYDRPLTPFVAEFIGETNFFTGEVTESGDGTFTVDVGPGLLVRGRGDTAAGAPITVGIRSERMTAAPAAARHTGPASAAPAVNTAPAEVVTKMYLGDQIQIVARLVNGVSVIVREQRATADPALDTIHPGDSITVGWDDTAPHVLGTAGSTAASPEEER
jgi:spermidine/putrescine ABC transporter ATP-binding subunit